MNKSKSCGMCRYTWSNTQLKEREASGGTRGNQAERSQSEEKKNKNNSLSHMWGLKTHSKIAIKVQR